MSPMYRCAGCGYRLPTPRLCKACERRREAKTPVVRERRISANRDGGQYEYDLTDEQRAELYTLLATCGIDVRTDLVGAFTYDLVDLPLLHVERFAVDDQGQTILTAEGDALVVETIDVPIPGPLPTWWQPSAVSR